MKWPGNWQEKQQVNCIEIEILHPEDWPHKRWYHSYRKQVEDEEQFIYMFLGSLVLQHARGWTQQDTFDFAQQGI